MRLAIRPPEYFPRLSYFALMLQSDAFFIADTFQYSRQSFQNRMQIRTAEDKQWLTIPLEGGQFGKSITQTKLDTRNLDWKRQHLRSLKNNYQSSAFYLYYEEAFGNFLMQPFTTLAEIAIGSIRLIHELLGFTNELHLTSQFAETQKDFSVTHLIHTVGNASLLALPTDAAFYEKQGLSVCKLVLENQVYHQNFQGFVPNLSILDVLFNYGPESVSILQAMTDLNTLEASCNLEESPKIK